MRWYKVRRNHRTRVPGAIVTVDTESYERPGRGNVLYNTYPLRFGHARYCRIEGARVNRRKELDFTDAEVFWDWLRALMDRRRTLWLWAHNLGWDLTVLRFWKELEAGRFTLVGPVRKVRDPETGEWLARPTPGQLYTHDPPTAVRCWDRQGAPLRACCTVNWFQTSLAKLGDRAGLAKIECDPLTAPDDELRTYCRRDVEITERVVLGLIHFIRDNDLGNLRYTPAAQAYSAWRHIGDFRRCEPHCDPEMSDWERTGYYGGKRFCYFRGEVVSPAHFALESDRKARRAPPREYTGPVTQLDTNAAYAAVMIEHPFPVRFERFESLIKVKRALELLKVFGGIARVLIESNSEPWPRRTEERLWWNVGRFQTTLAGPELVRALEGGYVQEVFQLGLYQMGKPFGAVMSRFLAIEGRAKAAGDELGVALVKWMRNALHGKFGERCHGWEFMPGHVAPEPWGKYTTTLDSGTGWEWRRSVAWQVQRLNVSPCTKNTFVPVAAFCTAYCRERMRQLVEKAGPRGCFYVDADSLHVSKSGLQALELAGEVDPSWPGKLRVLKTADYVRYYAPLHYRWGDELVLAGLPKNAVEQPDGTYRVKKFHRLNWYIEGGPPDGGVVTEEVIDAPNHQLAAAPSPDGWTRPVAV